MIRCMIVEDEPLAQDILKKYISETIDFELVSVSHDGVEALQVLEDHPVDLIFLDVNLPKLSGINFYKSLVNKPAVVFTTAYPEFAVEGFELDAVDYLLKPFSFERFNAAIEKVRDQINIPPSEEVLFIKQDKKFFRIPYEGIIYIESIRDYVKVHAKDKQWISSETLKRLEEILPPKQFIRIHKSYIVAISQIDYLEGNQVKVGDLKLPVGQSFRQKIADLFKK